MGVDVLLGLQWGDEGKGKIIDRLCPDYQIVCRFQGGPNAGHTLYVGDQKIVLHTIPSAILHDGIINLIGNGVVIDPVIFKKEIEKLSTFGYDISQKLIVARKAHLILPTHQMLDIASEASKGQNKIGSTLKGIGPTYMDKTGRNGIRVGDLDAKDFDQKYRILKEKHLSLAKIYPEIEFDLEALEQRWFESLEVLRSFPKVDSEYYVDQALSEGKNILAEGAQGSMLDVDFGTYPYVTSSNTISAGVCTGVGIAPNRIRKIMGVTKAYCTRVGSGPFPTELHDETGDELRKAGMEFGSTTGRPRRCGWIDLVQLRYSIMINGVDELIMTKIDVMNEFETVKACTHYKYHGGDINYIPFELDHEVSPVYTSYEGWQSDLGSYQSYDSLPIATRSYIDALEEQLGRKFSLISVGVGRDEVIVK
ncbi:MAG: adenylosuccinate synthase [Saprospiraceae bacterium]|nr:adenylosuccinate synthase [Saprospiraceae bacterium]